MLGPCRRPNHLENGRREELMPYSALFFIMWSWNQMNYNYFGCWFQKQIYEAQDSALLIQPPPPQKFQPLTPVEPNKLWQTPQFQQMYVYWLRVKFNKTEGKDIRGGKKGEKESILLRILDLIFLSFAHPTCTNIPHKILTTSLLVNMNFKKELRFWESFWESSLVTSRKNMRIS